MLNGLLDYQATDYSLTTRIVIVVSMVLMLYVLSFFLGLPSETRFPFTLGMTTTLITVFYEWGLHMQRRSAG